MFQVLMLPVLILNMFGSIVSGIWLAWISEWHAIVQGLIGIFTAHWFLYLVFAPGMRLTSAALPMLEKGKIVFAAPLLMLSNLYINAVVAAWCLLVMWYFVADTNSDNVLPLMIWSYGVALAPFQYMAQQQRPGEDSASLISAMAAQIAYVMAAVSVLLFSASEQIVVAIFVVALLCASIIELVYAYVSFRLEHPPLRN
jgi:hypothetical protein